MNITDEQLLSLPFDELAARCADADELTLVAVRLGDLATPSFPAQPGSLAHALSTEIERRSIAWVQYCSLLRESEYACADLRAFGHVIAAVARAQLIAHAATGHTIRVDMDNPNAERGLELWQRGASLCLSEYAPNRAPRRLWQIEGQPEDHAAEAVALLLAEVGL